MTNRIFSIPNLHYEMKGASYTTIEMDMHHHKPSMALVKARQLRDYRIHLDPQTRKREANENKNRKEKENFDSIQITMKEKITCTGVTLNTSLFSLFHEMLAQRPSTLVLMMINSCSYVY